MKGTKTAQLFAHHVKERMVSISEKWCTEQGHTKRPIFGEESTKTAQLCTQSRKGKMVVVYKKKR